MTAKTEAKPKFSIAGIDPEAKANKGIEWEVVDPETGKGIGMFLTCLPSDSTVYKEQIHAKINARRQAEFEAQQSGNPLPPQLFEKDIEETINVLVACHTGWRGIVIDEEEGEIPFTPENARRLFSFDFIRKQANEKVEKTKAFING